MARSQAWRRAWTPDGELASYTTLGLTLVVGNMPQAAWGYLTTAHPTQADTYPGFAYLAKPNYDLGSSATLPNHNFEVQGLLYNTQVDGLGDADCALLVQDFLTDQDHGVQFPTAMLDADALLSGPDAATTGDSAYQTYCQALGFGLSPWLTDQAAASETVGRWCDITNTATVWTGYSLKLVPFGDQTVTAHGVTFLPPTAVRYALTDSDFQSDNDQDPVKVSRSDPADAYNVVKLNVRDRNNAYNKVPATYADDNAISLYGRREASPIDAPEVCETAMAGSMAELLGLRTVYVRNQHAFALDPRFDALEPMDVVTITDPDLGLNAQPVRILSIEEQDDDTLNIIAELFPGTTGAGGAPTSGGTSPNTVNRLASGGPVNPPVIIEPPSTLTNGVAELWIAVSGGDGTTADPLWGGCIVYISLTGTDYQSIGEITSVARMGKTTASLASFGGANPDTVHTLKVDLSMSGGDLQTVSSAAAAAAATLCVVGGELLAFETATLTGSHAYDLTTLYRGLDGTAAGSHASGVSFARLDDNTFKFQLPAAYIGQVLHAKFQSFNIWGNALEDLAGCTDYTFTPAGTGFGGGSGGVPTAPTGLTATPSAGAATVSWTLNPAADNVTVYKVYRAPGTGASFGSAALIGTAGGGTYTDATVSAASYTYFVVAHNVVGDSSASSGANFSATTSGGLWGFAFEKDVLSSVTGVALVDFSSEVAWTIKAGMALASIRLSDDGTAPTAQTDWDLQVNGVSVGTVRFAASGTVATFIKAADTAVAANVKVQLYPPSSLNGMTGRIYGSIVGPR
jgi:hypothetical protein